MSAFGGTVRVNNIVNLLNFDAFIKNHLIHWPFDDEAQFLNLQMRIGSILSQFIYLPIAFCFYFLRQRYISDTSIRPTMRLEVKGQ